MIISYAFASKEIPDSQKRLLRRKHGYTFTLEASGDTVYSVSIPYAHVKLNEGEVLWCPEGVTVDMKVKDDASGTYSGTANAQLEQYGYTVGIAKDFFKDLCVYDGDFYYGMVLEMTFHNSTATEKTICLNLVFHEVVT